MVYNMVHVSDIYMVTILSESVGPLFFYVLSTFVHFFAICDFSFPTALPLTPRYAITNNGIITILVFLKS